LALASGGLNDFEIQRTSNGVAAEFVQIPFDPKNFERLECLIGWPAKGLA
jgi:hypothetical protein